LDVSTLIAGPLAAGMLGDFGAEVIKVEQPGVGDPVRSYARTQAGVSLYHKVTNRNKRCITLDLHTECGRDILRRLVPLCDVLVTNFRPTTLAGWKIDYEDLRPLNPGLVMLHLSAFGRTGPYRERPGFARIAEAFAGLTEITGEADGPPLFSSFPLADGSAGVYGAYAVLLALLHRQRSGEGQLVDMALYEPIVRMLEDVPAVYGSLGVVRRRQGNRNPGVAPNDLYPARDGRWIVLPVSTQRMFERLADAMGYPELIQDPRFCNNTMRVANRGALDEYVRKFLLTRDADDMVSYLHNCGVAAGTVNSIVDITRDEHIADRKNLISVWDEELQSNILMPNVVPRLEKTPGRVLSAGEGLGASNAYVYGQLLGLSPDEMVRLRQEGAI
jgi:crotonobetainyl-CoA:carnitine CoA-transferase CaiB-like acyl-CoA transferase